MFHMNFRIGEGWDVHALVPGRKLILGGIEVPHELGLLGHSDADVLLHAITDALLGGAALGDIGRHFPDTDPEFRGADSLVLLVEAGRPRGAPGGPPPGPPHPAPPPSQSSLPLGELQVWENRGHYLEVLRDSTLRVLLGYALFTALVCLMVAWVMRRELRQPLQQIAGFAANLKPNELSRPLVLERARRGQRDEIDMVVQGFGQLQHDLRGHIEHLDLLVAQRTAQLEELVEEVKRMSLTDALTGCLDRRAMDERLASEVAQGQRLGAALSVMFVDVDRFKQVNDRHGHAAGDAVLREVALRCRHALEREPSAQWMARYGGEEFLIVMPGVAAAQAWALAGQLREAIRSTPIQVHGLELAATASFGVAQLQGAESAQELLQRADAMLYEAKHAGRDCVRVAGLT